jgi:hypothetical protein
LDHYVPKTDEVTFIGVVDDAEVYLCEKEVLRLLRDESGIFSEGDERENLERSINWGRADGMPQVTLEPLPGFAESRDDNMRRRRSW